MQKLFKRFIREESGQAMVEYGLIIALVALAVAAALTGLGDKLKELFTSITGQIKTTP